MSSSKPPLEDLRIHRNPDPPRRTPAWVVVAFAMVLVCAAALLWWRQSAGAVPVRCVAAKDLAGGSVADHTVLNASGYVTARREATVSSKVTGKVVEVLIEEGMKVKEGQVLAKLDTKNVKASLDVAEAQLDSAKVAVDETRALLKQADLDYQRTQELARQKIASQSDLDRAQSDADSLRARLARQERDITVAERELEMWQQQMDDMIIRAPFDGVVTTKDSQPGEMISPVSAGGGFTRTGIGTIVDMTSLEVEIDVNESYINRVEPGQPVEATLDAYPDWKIPCKVLAIIPTADRQKSTVKVRVSFDKLDPRILPDMSVKVAFREMGLAGASARRVLVPRSCVRNADGRDVVFVVRDGRAERRAVNVGSAQDSDVTITAGVEPGEQVVTDPPAGLADRARVKNAD